MLLAHAAAWFDSSRCDFQIKSVIDYEHSIICCESQITFFQEWAWEHQADIIHQFKNITQWCE